MDINKTVDQVDTRDEIADCSDKSNATRITTHECPKSIPIPPFVFQPTLDKSNAPAMTTSQAGSLNPYLVPPSTPTTPNTTNVDVLAEVASKGLPDSPPSGQEASDSTFNAAEEPVSPLTRISTESTGDVLMEAASILGGIKKTEDEHAQADSLTKNTEVQSDIPSTIENPFPPDLEENYIQRVGTLFERAQTILENLETAREDPYYKFKVFMHCWMEQSIQMEVDEIPEADQESRFNFRCKMEADLLQPEQLSGMWAANSPSHSRSPLYHPSERGALSSINLKTDNTKRQLKEKLRNQQLRSGMRVAKSPADALSNSDNLNLPPDNDAPGAFPMALDEIEFGSQQNNQNDSDSTQSCTTDDEYDTDATITDPNYNLASDTDMEGVDKPKLRRGRPPGSTSKKGSNQKAQKPATGKTKAKDKTGGGTKYAKQPIYNGPPAYLLDPNRNDIYANTANSYRDDNGVFLWTDEERDAPFTPAKTTRATQVHNEEENEYSLPPVTPHLEPSPGMTVEPSFSPLKPTPVEPEETPFTPRHHAPRAPKIKLTMSKSARTSAEYTDKLNKQGMFPSTDGCYDLYALPQFGNITASKESSMRSTLRSTVSKDLDFDDPLSEVDTMNFNPNHKRYRSPSPNEDDRPRPLYNDMTLPLKKQRYVIKGTGKYTTQTPQEYEDEQAELRRRREERKRKDDAERHQGLVNFDGSQRGWNGEEEEQRQITLQKEQLARDRKLQVEIEKERAVAKSKQSTARPKTKKEKVDENMLQDSFLALQNQAAINQLALDDEIEDRLEELNAMMRSRNVDMDAIKREAIQVGRERNANNGKPVSRSPLKPRSPQTPGTPTRRKRKSNSNSPANGRRSSSEEERLKGHNLGKDFDPPTTEKRVVKKRRAFGV